MTSVPLPVPRLRVVGGAPDGSAEPAPRAAPSAAALAARIGTHPCYSDDAHQYYARMHIPVAPGCNIQCHYCNRKFDCSNESRPGVTSALLSPEQALARVKQVARAVPQLSVVGVAGPGEPLANAARTLGTLELIARECPDLTLCLSTNGLTLLDHVDRIVSLGVEHVTVTVNMTDPQVGARIYPWITHRGRKIIGREASHVLSERQLEGVAALQERGVIVKVNSVLIPGVNDEHLVEVSRTVRDLGVLLHNIMPLVSAPEHGTHYGLTGQRGPTPQELQALQDRCEQLYGGEGLRLMRHCRQCRADAVGLLADDQGETLAGPLDYLTTESQPDLAPPTVEDYDVDERRVLHERIERRRTAARRELAHAGVGESPEGRPDRTVLIAVATSGGGIVNQHFGRAEEFAIYEAGANYARIVGTRSVSRYCRGPATCGTAHDKLESTAAMLADCAAVLCSQAGAGPRRALAAVGVEVIEMYGSIERAVADFGARLTPTRTRRAR